MRQANGDFTLLKHHECVRFGSVFAFTLLSGIWIFVLAKGAGGMFTPEVLLFSGSAIVVISAFLLVAALHVRGWFFIPDPKVELQRVDSGQAESSRAAR